MTYEISLKLSLFDGIERVFYIEKDVEITLYSISFIKCTHPIKCGCFYVQNNGASNVSMKNVCFVSCTAQNIGIGQIEVKTQHITLIDVSSSGMNKSDQRDALYLINGVHLVNGLNSTKNRGVSPLITCSSASTGEYKYMKANENTINEGVSFFEEEHSVIKSSSFISSNFQSQARGVVWIVLATAYIANCDFAQNNGPLFCCSGSEATCSECFYENNYETRTYENVTVVSTRVIASKEFWTVATHKCHLFLSFTERSQIRGLVIMTAVSLLNKNHKF